MTKRLAILLFALSLLLPCLALGESAEAFFAAAPTIEEAVTLFLTQELQNQAEQTEDGWQRFIYQQGPAEITMNLEKFDIEKGKALSVSFKVAGGQPKVKAQPQYEGDPARWLQGIVEAMGEHDSTVKTSLLIATAPGGYTVQFAPKAEGSLQKSVKSLATKAAKAFSNKTILSAVTDYLMPTPIAVPKKAPALLAPAEYRPVFLEYLSRNGLSVEESAYLPAILYGLKGYKLDVSEGPEAFALTYTAPNLDTLIGEAAQSLGRDLCYDARVKEYSAQERTRKMAERLERDVAAYRHGKKSDEKESYTFSLLALPEALDPSAFYTHLEDAPDIAFQGALSDLLVKITLMPDYPAQPDPKTGLIRGESKGTKCTFKAYNDGYSRCVSVYRSNGEHYSTVFIASGKSTTVRIPQGNYYFVIGIGEVWYGEEHLFGDLGGYSKSEGIEVASNRYYHTFTLNPKRDGNTELYRLSFDDLFQ